MDEAEAGIREQRAKLGKELRAAQREARRLGRRVEALDRQRAERHALIQAIEASYSRAYEKSGSWESLRVPVDLRLANSAWTAESIAREIGVRPAVVPTGIDRALFGAPDVSVGEVSS